MSDLASLARMDAMAQAELYRRGDVSADELFTACLDRMEALNPLLHAVITLVRDAPAAPRGGPLAAVPFVMKDASPWPGLRSVDRTRATPVQEHELEPFTWALLDAFQARGPDALPRARAAFAQAVRAYRDAAQAYDVVVTPTIATEPWRLGHLSPTLGREELIRRTAQALGYTPIQNIAGAPAMSVPLCFPDGGMPIGTHLAAAPGGDALLLGLAYELEQARPWKDRWPPYSIPALERRALA